MAGVVHVEKLDWRDVQLDTINFPKAELKLTLGIGSGLCARNGRLFAVTDRGPNLFVSQAVDDYGLMHLACLRPIRDAKIMPMPDTGPEIAELKVEGGALKLLDRTILRTRSGRRLSGRVLAGGEMEQVFDVHGHPVQPDALGADTEAIAVMPDGGFFLAEEYGPSLLKADAGGIVSERWVAAGREGGLSHPDILVRGVLPASVANRRVNRGFEALAASEDGAFIYLALQSAHVDDSEESAPVWKLDARTGAVVAEWRYPFDAPSSFLRDAARRKVGHGDLKICEFAWAGEDRLIVLERIAHSTKLYDVSLNRLPEKVLLVSSDDHRQIEPDVEGMALLSPTEILICSDNDFGVEGAATGFWRIVLERPLA